jgi:hypothetical protein
VSDATEGAIKVVVAGVLPTAAAASATARAHGGHLVQGCTFADRCPHVMDMCRPNVPPLYRLDPARAASCFLYRDQGPAISSEQLNEVMAATDSSAYA